jgi:hypothetical protein
VPDHHVGTLDDVRRLERTPQGDRRAVRYHRNADGTVHVVVDTSRTAQGEAAAAAAQQARADTARQRRFDDLRGQPRHRLGAADVLAAGMPGAVATWTVADAADVLTANAALVAVERGQLVVDVPAHLPAPNRAACIAAAVLLDRAGPEVVKLLQARKPLPARRVGLTGGLL